MNRKIILKFSISIIFAAMSVVLELFLKIDFGSFKITLYPLPLMLVSIFFGPLIGILCGLLSGFCMQVFSGYGIDLFTPLYMIAPLIWSTIPGLISSFIKKNYVPFIIIGVVLASLLALLANTIPNIMWYGLEAAMADLWIRLAISSILMIVYSIILCLMYKYLVHYVTKKKNIYDNEYENDNKYEDEDI